MVKNHYRWDFIGLSTDTKPTPATSEKVVDGSTYYCSDTSKLYVYCKDNWYERKPLGGGGGGGTSDFNDLTNRPKYNGQVMTGNTDIPEEFKLITDDDVNWQDPQSGDSYVALWLLPTGRYTTNENSPNVVISTDELNGDYIPGYSIAVDMKPLIIINNGDPGSGNVYPDIMTINPDSIAHFVVAGDTGLIDSVQDYGSPFIGADEFNDGIAGLVPAPMAGQDNNYLRGNGSWAPLDTFTIGSNGVVPAPTESDVLAGNFLKANGTWEAASSGIKELSADDYNYPANNPDRVGLWLLEPGMYKIPRTGVSIYYSNGDVYLPAAWGEFVIIERNHAGLSPMTMYFFGNDNGMYFAETLTSGVKQRGLTYTLLSDSVVQTTGTSTSQLMSQKAVTDALTALETRIAALEGN